MCGFAGLILALALAFSAIALLPSAQHYVNAKAAAIGVCTPLPPL